ncbi:hypothetical protein LUZ60_013259 [Juncus effusus]|nr:hypothetical protein LUZ60_013259 [Juncus effusus]
MARNLTSPSFQLSPLNFRKHPRAFPNPFAPLQKHPRTSPLKLRRCRASAQQKTEMATVSGEDATSKEEKWGKVSAVLFDMDGVLCNSEELSRLAAVDVFADLGVAVTAQDFVPFMGTGEANFLGGVAKVKGVKDLTTDDLKKRFFDVYLTKYAKPNSGIGFPGALELIKECKGKGLKVAVASSADRIKVDANLSAAGLSLSLFDAIVSADAFQNLKPAPDIFLAASKILHVDPSECLVIEDALAGVQAANAAQMRCIAVTTTLSEEALGQAKPTIVRKEIGNISISDILYGGSFDSHNEKSKHKSEINGKLSGEFSQETSSTNQNGQNFGGLLGSRRDLLRYASLGVAIFSFLLTLRNWKAMKFASPKGLLNFFIGQNSSIFGQNKGETQSTRKKQIMNYLADFESKGSGSNVPEFPEKLDWLNSAPLRFSRDLKGRIVVLDFWTYCCINCMHVLPDLDYLETKYKNKPFTVVGVHSAKFDNEKDLDAIRNAVLRYNISHPVVNDGNMYMWREIGVNSWPTFVIVGPTGKILAQLAGEGRRKDLDDVVDAALEFYRERNMLEEKPLPLALERESDKRLSNSPLKFPGKIAIDVLNNRLFVSDSNHNRIVVTSIDGDFISQVGSTGEEGLSDGSFDTALFNRPQGLAYNPKKNVLYVADTENHALREIDFVNETVKTLAGNGTKGSDYKGGGQGNSQVLNSPWDLCYDPSNETVYIAMAGQHQIWEYNILNGITTAFSGNGYERNQNGSSSASTSYAQPSGISLSPDMQEAYIADSESSSIRAVDLKSGGSRLIAGGDPMFPENLFRFGDKDGIGSGALLQHPLGVLCGSDNQIYVADSYNHKIKKIDPVTKQVTTLAGTGIAGYKDGPALSSQLSEPAGLVEASNGRLIIADTNNSVIRYIDINDKDPQLRTLELKDVQPPLKTKKSLKRLRRRLPTDAKVIKIDAGKSRAGYLSLSFSVPEGYHFSKEAKSKFEVEMERENVIEFEPSIGNLNPDGSASIRFKRISSDPTTGRINCKVYYCKEDEVCLYQPVSFDVSFQQKESSDSNPAQILLKYAVVPKITTGTEQLIFSK